MAELVKRNTRQILVSEGTNENRVTRTIEKDEDSRLKNREKKLVRKRKQEEHFKFYYPNLGPLNSGTLEEGGKVKS